MQPARAQESTAAPAGAATDVAAEDARRPKPKRPRRKGWKQVGEEIVVTARRREENLQEVPIAVTVVTGDRLEETAAADISELQGQVPNLAIYQGRNQSSTLTAFMRGIGQADPLWGVDPGVGLYIDDVYLARPQGALLDVYDVGRIEVLRGPQGTLYGKNTIGGAIKYVSRPLTDDTAAMVSVSPGTQSNLDLRASFAGALIPGKGARQAGDRLAAARRLRHQPLHRPGRFGSQDPGGARRARLVDLGRRQGGFQPRLHARRRRAQGLPASGGEPPLSALPRRDLPPARRSLGHPERPRAGERHRLHGRLDGPFLER